MGPTVPESRLADLDELLSPCRLCPRECGADRRAGETGYCGIGLLPKIAAISVHCGEEPPLSGTRGAGNIFFTGCNLGCRFCQNFPISQFGVGREMDPEQLAERFLLLQERGVHNINLVTPSHVAPQAARAVALAREQGLRLPVVWNSNGYEAVRTVELLSGTVDIYLPDMKYASDSCARRCSGVNDYVSRNRAAVAAMVRQVGAPLLDEEGVARRGVIVRHLILPGDLAGTREVLLYLAAAHAEEVGLSLMAQYFPAHQAHDDPLLSRRITRAEYLAAVELLERTARGYGWYQSYPGG